MFCKMDQSLHKTYALSSWKNKLIFAVLSCHWLDQYVYFQVGYNFSFFHIIIINLDIEGTKCGFFSRKETILELKYHENENLRVFRHQNRLCSTLYLGNHRQSKVSSQYCWKIILNWARNFHLFKPPAKQMRFSAYLWVPIDILINKRDIDWFSSILFVSEEIGNKNHIPPVYRLCKTSK